MPLPGEAAQMKMAPIERINELRELAGVRERARQAAVLALFYPAANKQTHFVLILRKTYPGVHSAQIGFPGGRREPQDRNFGDTALRETQEEVGVPVKQIQLIKELTEVFIPPSNYVVRPFLGVTTSSPHFVAQEEEVEQIIEVPLLEFLDQRALVERRLSTSYATDILVPAFELQQHTVWGATAMMLSELREMLLEVS